MTEPSPSSTERRSHPPMWLVEGLDVVQQRRPAFIAVTLGVVVLGGLLALLVPGLVPPVPLVGAAVGLAAVVLGVAVAIALDATDLRLRGPRHVGAAGGELVAVLPNVAEHAGATTLAAAVLEARDPAAPLLLGLAASGRDVRPTVAWTDALASALVEEGVSVLRIDLASGHTRSPGLLEVVRDGVKLASVVTFGPEPKLARLGAGEDLNAALAALTALPGRLPRDLDVLLVALPMAASRPVVAAVQSLDHVLIVAQRDRTSRVELIAGLDALEAAGTRAQVALLDDRTAARLARRSPDVVTDPATDSDGDEPDIELAGDPDGGTSADPGGGPPAGPDAVPPPDAGGRAAAERQAESVDDPTDQRRAPGSVDLEAGPSETATTAVDPPGEVDPPAEVGPETAENDSQPSLSVRSGSSESPPTTGGRADPAAEDEPDAASGEEGPQEPDTAPGPRSGGAFGVGGAALTAAGVAATFGDHDSGPEPPGSVEEPRPHRPVEEPHGADELHGSPQDPTEASGAAALPVQRSRRKPILGLEAEEHEGALERDDAHGRPVDERLSWDDTPREPRVPHGRMESEHSGPRPDEVVQGAAEAAAIALVRFPAEPPFDSDEPGTEVEGALPVGSDAAVAVRTASDLPPAPVDLDPVGADADDAEPDPADGSPSVRSEPESGEVDAEHEELMRTTAQLSVLSDDLDIDRDEGPLDTP